MPACKQPYMSSDQGRAAAPPHQSQTRAAQQRDTCLHGSSAAWGGGSVYQPFNSNNNQWRVRVWERESRSLLTATAGSRRRQQPSWGYLSCRCHSISMTHCTRRTSPSRRRIFTSICRRMRRSTHPCRSSVKSWTAGTAC